MKVIIPGENLGVPAGRGRDDIRILMKGRGYVVNEIVAEMLAFADQEGAQVFEPEPRPPNEATRRLLINFPGGIGDVICMKACLEALDEQMPYPNLEEVGFVSFREDDWLLNDRRIKPFRNFRVVVYDYPILWDIAKEYDAWLSYGALERQSVNRELQDTFAEILGVEPLRRPASLCPDYGLQRALSALIADKNRIKVGIQCFSAAHYRSWPPHYMIFLTYTISEWGCDVYHLGLPTQQVRFTKGEPPEHYYDVSGLLTNIREFVAFVSLLDAVITVDTALLHIAGCLYKPTLALFGMTNGAVRTSYYPTVEYLQGEAECAPCLNIANVPECGAKFCEAMIDLNPEKVAEAFRKILTEADLL